MGQVTFLVICTPACYASDRLLQRGAVSRFPTMAAAAALSSACSFVVLGNARDCSAGELTVSHARALTLVLLLSETLWIPLLPLLCFMASVVIVFRLCRSAYVFTGCFWRFSSLLSLPSW